MSKRTKRLKLLEDFRSGEYTLTEINDQLEKLEAEAEKAARYNCNAFKDQPNDVHIGFFNEGYKRGFTAGGICMLVDGPKDLGSAEEKSDV